MYRPVLASVVARAGSVAQRRVVQQQCCRLQQHVHGSCHNSILNHSVVTPIRRMVHNPAHQRGGKPPVAKNTITAAILLSFCAGVYYYSVNRMAIVSYRHHQAAVGGSGERLQAGVLTQWLLHDGECVVCVAGPHTG